MRLLTTWVIQPLTKSDIGWDSIIPFKVDAVEPETQLPIHRPKKAPPLVVPREEIPARVVVLTP
jgi:hypothetical protein